MQHLKQAIIEAGIISFNIKDTLITLENKGVNKGQINVSDNQYGNYSMYWGAMGGTIQEFIIQINSDYFTDKLLGAAPTTTFDVRATFASLRKYIRTELELPWYKHQEFQANLRENLNLFQERCTEYNSDQYFVDHFHDYLYRYPSFYLIDDRFDQERIESEFQNISEPWNFIQTKESDTAKWLKALHFKIKARLLSGKHLVSHSDAVIKQCNHSNIINESQFPYGNRKVCHDCGKDFTN